MIVGGVLAVVASFFDTAFGTHAWGDFAFPIVTLIPIYLGAVAVLVIFSRFGNLRLAPRAMGFTWPQIYLLLGLFAALMAGAWIVADPDPGIGLYLMLAGAIAVVVGALLSQRGRRRFRSIEGGW
jgi:DMSO/TMAO reductase YedYZ heme-binding membrane subunit